MELRAREVARWLFRAPAPKAASEGSPSARPAFVALSLVAALLVVDSTEAFDYRDRRTYWSWLWGNEAGDLRLALAEDLPFLVVLGAMLTAVVVFSRQVAVVESHFNGSEERSGWLEAAEEAASPKLAGDLETLVDRANRNLVRFAGHPATVVMSFAVGVAFTWSVRERMLGEGPASGISGPERELMADWWLARNSLGIVFLVVSGYVFSLIWRQQVFGVVVLRLVHTLCRNSDFAPQIEIQGVDPWYGLSAFRGAVIATFVSALCHWIALTVVLVVWVPHSVFSVSIALVIGVWSLAAISSPVIIMRESIRSAKQRALRQLVSQRSGLTVSQQLDDESATEPTGFLMRRLEPFNVAQVLRRQSQDAQRDRWLGETERRIQQVRSIPDYGFGPLRVAIAATTYLLVPAALVALSALLETS